MICPLVCDQHPSVMFSDLIPPLDIGLSKSHSYNSTRSVFRPIPSGINIYGKCTITNLALILTDREISSDDFQRNLFYVLKSLLGRDLFFCFYKVISLTFYLSQLFLIETFRLSEQKFRH